MTTTTHICAGLACGTIIASFYTNAPDIRWGLNGLTGLSCGLVVLGATVPDLDSAQSPIARALPFLGRPISRHFPHRTLLHSLSGLLLWTIGLYTLLSLLYLLVDVVAGQRPNHTRLFSLLFAFAYMSHLVLDTLTRQGVRWLYPLLKSPFAYPSSEQHRLITGDQRAEWSISFLAVVVMVVFVSFAHQGADVSLQNLIGKYKSLQDIYRQAERTEVVLGFVGHFEHDKSPVSGRALILETTSNYFVVWWQNKIYHVGEGQGDIFLRSGKCELLGIPLLVREVLYQGVRWEQIISDVGERVLISGELTANQPVMMQNPPTDRTVTVSPTSLSFHFASRADLEALPVHPKLVVSELQLEQEHKQRTVDSLVAARVAVRDLYQREIMLTQIEELRKEIEDLATKLKTQTGATDGLRFSGRVRLRTIPIVP